MISLLLYALCIIICSDTPSLWCIFELLYFFSFSLKAKVNNPSKVIAGNVNFY